MRTYVRMVVCVYLPRFELVVAAGGPKALAGRALAIAPAPGTEARVGEISGSAEACGVVRGMRLGEALARCPELVLVPADPLGVAEQWEQILTALEDIGAAPESAHVGLAYFQADGLRGLYGGQRGRRGGVPSRSGDEDGGYEGVLAAARRALGARARLGAGPTRFCALAAALEVRSKHAVVVRRGEVRGYLAARPVTLLLHREQTAALVEHLRRLGVRTLGELAALGRVALADRFGAPGVFAYWLAQGNDTPLCPRRREEPLEEWLQLAQSGSGPALERVLGLLIDRLLARPQRRGRTLRVAILSALLVERGTWRERVVFRQALSDPRRMRLALAPRLALLPAPAESLALVVERFGPPQGEQAALPAFGGGDGQRRELLREGLDQVRAVAGPEAALRAQGIDLESRVPERRIAFTPYPA
jgi:protein ImuB